MTTKKVKYVLQVTLKSKYIDHLEASVDTVIKTMVDSLDMLVNESEEVKVTLDKQKKK